MKAIQRTAALIATSLAVIQIAGAAPEDQPETKFTTFLWSAPKSTEEKTELIYHDVNDSFNTRITFTREKEFRRADGVGGTWQSEGGKLVLKGDGFTIIFEPPTSGDSLLTGRIPAGRWKGHTVLLKLVGASAQQTSTPPGAKGADSEAMTVETLAAFAPPDAKLKKSGKWQPVGAALTTEAMKAKGIGQPIDFKIKVAVIEPHTLNGHTMLIRSILTPVKINGTTVPYVMWAYFDADGLAGLDKVRAGDSVTISGILQRSDIEISGDSATLVCNVLKARLKQPTSKR